MLDRFTHTVDTRKPRLSLALLDRCFVTVERKRSEPSRESYACTEEGCEKANAVPAHPLSIAAILDLHCAHVEYCKKAAHIGMALCPNVAHPKICQKSRIRQCFSAALASSANDGEVFFYSSVFSMTAPIPILASELCLVAC